MKLVILVLVLCFSKCSIYCAKILAIMPIPSYSHQIMFRPLWKELLKRGHELTLVTTDPMTDHNYTNLRQIDWSFAYHIKYEKHKLIQKIQEDQGIFSVYKSSKNTYIDVIFQELQHPEFRAIMKDKNQHFDLLIVEFYIPVLFAFSNYFNCPYIGVVSADTLYAYHSLLGNYVHPVLFPEYFTPFYDSKANFFSRLNNVLKTHFFNYMFFSSTKDVYQLNKYFGMELPPLVDIVQNVSMLFLNMDAAFYLRPLGPATITIGGGTHLESLKGLPQDLDQFINSSKTGVIYFSLGSSVKSNELSKVYKKSIMEAFESLPHEVLWKYEGEDITQTPKNVKLVKWLPQQDVLRHPKIKLFITQGGLQSVEEATFSYVPMVVIPFVSDQERNAARVVQMGMGVSISKEQLINKDALLAAIYEVLKNPSYRLKTKEAALLSQDQPLTGLQKAVWWTEYVIRHKGAKHLRSPIIGMPSYQYYLVDVYGFLGFLLFIVVYVMYKIIKCVLLYFKRFKIKQE